MSFYSARKKAGLSQAAVAEIFDISAAAVCQWESGKTLPDPRKLPIIAALYGCAIEDLLAVDSDTETERKEEINA